jgi:hypothetical protein
MRSVIDVVREKIPDLRAAADTYFTGESATKNRTGKLESRLNTMRTDRALMAQAAETYDKEFLDRMETGRVGGGGFWARRGVSTVQDWILLLFFAVYVAWLIIFIAYTLRYSTKKLFTIAFILLFGPVFGVFIAALIMRLG